MKDHSFLGPPSTEQGGLFESIIALNNCKTIVEIGVAFADTTRYLCRGALKTSGKVYGFDCWSSHGQNMQFSAMSSRQECEDNLHNNNFYNFELFECNTFSSEFQQKINSLPKIDFAFIDGDHSYKGIKNDFDIIYKKLSNQGIVAFHDTLRIDGCREFIIDLKTIYNDGTFDVVDFPYGGGDRRVGISLLVKRCYSTVGIEIDEICGSISTPEEIYKKEQKYLNKI